MADRDNYFHPFGGLQGRNVYILYRFDKEHLLDDDMRNYIANNTSLELRKVPLDKNNIGSINAHFSRFGLITNLQVSNELFCNVNMYIIVVAKFCLAWCSARLYTGVDVIV